MTCLLVDVNLKELYPEHYKKDEIIQLKIEIVEVFKDFKKAEHTYNERIRRNKAYYYLDYYEWLENYAVDKVLTPVDILNQKEKELKLQTSIMELEKAISKLTIIQQRRIHKYFYEGKNASVIAREEGISHSAVNDSLVLALKQLRKSFEDNPLKED